VGRSLNGVVAVVPLLVPVAGRPDAAEETASLLERGPVRMAQLRPVADGYPLTGWVLSPLPELCDAYSVALLLDFAPGPIDWAGAVSLARAYPRVPFVVLGCDLSSELAAGAALDAALNLVLHLRRETEEVRPFLASYGRRRFVRGAPEAGFTPPARDDGLGELDETAAELAAGTYAAVHL